MTLRAPAWLAAVAATALAAVGVALFTQYRMDMMPCAWCVLQRLVFVAIAVAALVGRLSAKSPPSGMQTSLHTSQSARSFTSSVSPLKPAGTVTGAGSSSVPS